MAVLVKNLAGGGNSLVHNYYIFAEQARKISDSTTSNIVSITGTNSTFTDRMTSPFTGYNEFNITGESNIIVRFSKAVKATKLIYEAYAQNTGSRRFDWCALDGSNDGSSWTQLKYVTIGQANSHSSTPHVVDLDVTGKYLYYRYRVSTNNYVYIRHPFDIVVE